MRPSKYDKWVVLACLIIFLYSFFIIGGKPIYESDLKYPNKPLWWGDDGRDEIVAVEWPTSVIIAPLVCIIFFCLWLFEDELRPINRHWVKKGLLNNWSKLKKNVREDVYKWNRFKKQR